MVQTRLALLPAFCLATVIAACGSDATPAASSSTGGGNGQGAGAPGQAGSSNAGAPAQAGGSNPNAGTGGSNSTTGGNPSTGGNPGIGGAPAAAGAAGMSSAGAPSMAGAGGGPPLNASNHGRSVGCGKVPPPADSSADFILHEAKITTPLDPVYLAPSGSIWVSNMKGAGPYDYTHRPYSVKLPKLYDENKAYRITIGGGGCGGNASTWVPIGSKGGGGGYQPDSTGSTIQVGLQMMNGCFDDGGPGLDLRTDTPDAPYVRAAIADVESKFCVDQSQVFIAGTSSGGWESFTVGCADSDVIRGIGAVSGGLRQHRPACKGPQASIMVEGLTDTENPIGPITPPVQRLDSTGSAAARDEILVRNGCVAPDFKFDDTDPSAGNAPHTPWDPTYPKCVTYTGCPAATPVVWCALACGHQCDKEGTTSYKAAIWKFWSSLPSIP